MSTEGPMTVDDKLDELMSMVINLKTAIDNLAGGAGGGRTAYTVEEAAILLKRGKYTVRQWCNEGRINATKRRERRGKAEVWSISAEEIERYRNEGLLPVQRVRRAG